MPNFMMNALEVIDVNIASGASVSTAVDLCGLRLFCIVMPSAWTSADLTFQVSYDAGASWSNLFEMSGAEVSVACDAGQCVAVEPPTFAAVPFLRVRSGTASVPIVQGGGRTLRLVLRSV